MPLAFFAMFIVDLASTPDWRGPAWLNILLLAGSPRCRCCAAPARSLAIGLWAGLIVVMARS